MSAPDRSREEMQHGEHEDAHVSLLRRLLPAPLLSLVLAMVWPVLNQSWSAGQLLLAALLAIVVPWFTEPLRADKPVLCRPGAALRLGLLVLMDIVTANLEVAAADDQRSPRHRRAGRHRDADAGHAVGRALARSQAPADPRLQRR
jgi:Na+/H+ ion antiporter subunit